MEKSDLINLLKEKAFWLRKEMLKIHKTAPNTRLASCLSDIELFTALYYGKILDVDPKNVNWEGRDRFIISKPHGAVSLYPILADFGFFDGSWLSKVSQNDSFLGDIPDASVPGFETTNGSLGHGLGVACGVALALQKKNSDSKVFVLSGDGELSEGSVWEAVMFAAEHKLGNLILIVDNNKISMLGYCKNIINLTPLQEKFEAFKWGARTVNGHNIEEVYNALKILKQEKSDCPMVLIANTIKGKGVHKLENDSLCHIRSLKEEEIINAINNLRND